MVVQCEINFDQNPYGTYFAGQMVSGTVTLRTDRVKIIKGCALKIKGSARTSWSDNVGVGSSRRAVNFYGNEDYFALTTYLLGSEESQIVTIEPGIQTYNFAYALPPQCPSSFEGQRGHIRYTVKVVFIRPWKFDQTYARGFTVIKLMDLNYESPILRMPAAQETYKTFCWGPCKKNPLKIDITIPQTGFVPGQTIPVSVLVTNQSKVPVTDVKISLIMMTIMFSQQPSVSSRIERTNLAKIKGGTVKTYSTRNIIESIRIPPTPPSCNRLCSILQISYQIEVEVKLKGMHKNPIMLLPLVIGNVPLVSVVQHQPLLRTRSLQLSQASTPVQLDDSSSFDKELFTISNGSVLPVVDPVRNPADPLSSAELNISPPSYEEAIYMARANCNEGDQHALASSEFVPRYPVYNIPEPSAPICDEPFTNTDPNKSTWL